MDKTLVNFRDLGGIPTQQGTHVKKNMIFRSGQPVGLSDEAKKELVDTYHIKTIVDFRTDQEMAQMPDDKIAGIQNIHIDIFENSSGSKTDLSSFEAHALDPDESMKLAYQQIVESPQAQENYHRFLELLNNLNNDPLLFHCFAGKDRTGFGAYLILKLLGVSEDDIMTDYMLSNPGRKEANDAIIDMERKNGLSEEQLDGLRVSLGVKEDYLNYSKSLIEKNYNGFDSYVKNQLKLDDSFITSFRKKFTE